MTKVRGAYSAFLLLVLHSPHEARPLALLCPFLCLKQGYHFIHKLVYLLPVGLFVNLGAEVGELFVFAHAEGL